MQKYHVKNRPHIIVDAEQLTPENVDRLANICQGQIVEEGRDRGSMTEAINVKTPNGKERLHQGMYLVQAYGDFYTAAPANFEMRYELHDVVNEPSVPPPTPTHPLISDDPWRGVPRIKDTP